MEDGSAPPQRVAIERACGDRSTHIETLAGRDGRYTLRSSVVRGSADSPSSGTRTDAVITGANTCELRAVLAGFESTRINIDDWVRSGATSLPTLVLGKRGLEERLREEQGREVPRDALKAWMQVSKSIEAQKWPEAERRLRDITRRHPNSAQAWHLLGTVQENAKDPAGARRSYLRASSIDPRWLEPYAAVARLDMAQKDWKAAVQSTARWIEADTRRAHLEAYVENALARVNREISHRSGKKVIVVFTDGADNASTLASDAVVKRAKTIGAPVYTIAQGQALRFPHVLKQLENVAIATGGLRRPRPASGARLRFSSRK